MPRRRRPRRIPTPVWEPRRGLMGRLGRQLGARAYLLAALISLVLIAGGLIAFALVRQYLEEREEERQEERERSSAAAITVGDRTYSMEYFADRLASLVEGIVGLDPQQAIALIADQIVEEETVRRFAADVGVSVSPEEVDEEIAKRLGLKRDDPSFAAAYEEEVDRSGLSDQDYRQIVEAQLLGQKIRAKLGEDIPAEVEQVHYRRLLVATEEEALQVVARLRAGEDFAALVQEVSLDTGTKDEGGDAGWLARGANAILENILFALEPGAISDPVSLEGGFYVFQAVEKATRPLDEDQKAQIQGQTYRRWLEEKRQTLEVINYVATDPEKLQWAVEHAYGS